MPTLARLLIALCLLSPWAVGQASTLSVTFEVGATKQFATIQAAVDAARALLPSAFDTLSVRIEISAGTYSEAITLDVPDPETNGQLNLTLAGKGKVVLAPPPFSQVFQKTGERCFVTLDRLRIDGQGTGLGVHFGSNTNAEVTRCSFRDLTGPALTWLVDSELFANYRLEVDKSRFERCGVGVDAAVLSIPEQYYGAIVRILRSKFRDVGEAIVGTDLHVLDVVLCKVLRGDLGIRASTFDGRVRQCSFRDCVTTAIQIETTVDSPGFELLLRIERNKVRGGCLDAAVQLLDSGPDITFLVERNRLSKISGDGLRLEGQGEGALERNKVAGVGGAGLLVTSDGNVLTKNRVSKAGDYGFRLDGTANQLSGNRTAKTALGGFGLSDAAGGNIYLEKNTFDSVDPENPGPF